MSSFTYTTTKNEEKTNKILAKIPPDFKCIGTGVKDQRNLIQENPEHGIIEEKPYKMEIVWPNAIAFLIMHLGALYSVYLCFFGAKFLTAFYGLFMVYFAGISVTIGAHRLYSHRSFKANKYIRFIIVFLHTMTGQNSIWTWARDHRAHHKYSDTNADPHNSRRGFFFSHMGWLMVRKHPEVIRKSRTIDMSDVKNDPIAMFQKNHYFKIFFILGIFLPTSIPCLLWNETIWNSFFISFVGRIVSCWNLTWLINSAAHLYGSRPYTKDISPTENTFVSMFVLGEGTHNYHHTFPWDYRGAEHTNTATRIIDYCLKKGWAHDAKTVSRELIKRQAMKKGDGSHPLHNSLNPNGVPVSENY